MIKGYVSSDEDDDSDSFYSEPLVLKNDPLPQVPVRTKEVREELDAALENSKKLSLFMKAVADGDLNVLKEIIDSGLDIDASAPQEWTALMQACQKGKFEVVQFLLEYGSDPNLNKELFTPLMVCCNYSMQEEEDKLNCVRLLLSHGAKVNMTDKYKTTALMYAIGSGYLSIVNELLEVPNIDLNIQDKEGWTALFYAVNHNLVDVVKKLVDAGCDQSFKDRHDRTALHLAQDKDFKQIAIILGDVEEEPEEKFNFEEIHSIKQYLKELPQANGEGGFYHDAKSILASFNQLNVKAVSLPDFLNMTDKDLYELGVKLKYDRQRILKNGIHEYHLFSWKKSGMYQVTSGVPLTMEDVIAITGNLTKHLTVANASLRYLDTRISSRLNNEPVDMSQEKELINVLVNSYVSANKIKMMLKKIQKHISKIELSFPGDYIYHEKVKEPIRIKTYFWHALSASTLGFLMYYFKHKLWMCQIC